MSDYRAIGSVSATLQTLLTDRMELPDIVTSAPVTIGPPPFSSQDNNPRLEDPRVNLFLYRVTENGYLQNQEIPGRGGSGGYGHPPLSLNLHYLVTAYGNRLASGDGGNAIYDDFTAHVLLGSAMRVLHDVPVITDRVTTVRAPSGRTVLDASLRDAFEQVKLTLEPLTLEDVTKVWSALVLRFRLSAAYVVNVVQIESQRPRRFPRPVGQPTTSWMPLPGDPPSAGPMVYAVPLQTPTITDVGVRRDGVERPFAYARIGDTLILRGTALSGRATHVQIDDVVIPAALARADRVEAEIPDDAIPGSGSIPPDVRLQPGVRAVRVITSDPSVAQSSFSSNKAAFMLVPAVDGANLTYTAGPPRTLTIRGARLVGPTPGGEAVIGRVATARAAYLTAAATRIDVRIPDSLPTAGASAFVGDPLPDQVVLRTGAQDLDITIGATLAHITANLTSPLAKNEVAGIVAALIRDNATNDQRFAGVRVDLSGDRLVIVPGGLTDPIRISGPAGTFFAADLGLTATQSPGTDSGLVSGVLTSPPVLSLANPRLTLKVGTQPPISIALAIPTSLADLADDLQMKIRAAGGPAEYANATVVTTGSQLLVVPGAPGLVVFAASPGDDRTVVELQLHARFAVRVRVNGAESVDEALVELPQ